MNIIGRHFHPRLHLLATLDAETGDVAEEDPPFVRLGPILPFVKLVESGKPRLLAERAMIDAASRSNSEHGFRKGQHRPEAFSSIQVQHMPIA